MGWNTCYKMVLPYVFQIETPQGAGTGFFFTYNGNKSLIGIATALHVVDEAESWKLPLKLRHHATGKELFVSESDRVIKFDRRRDSAAIIIANNAFDLPDVTLSMIPADKFQPVGTEVGWVGYPGIARPNLCFFTGRVSQFVVPNDEYLIDGVAINGVSGGPLFVRMKDDIPHLLGTVSAYMPNRVRGDALPGMMSAQDISPFHDVIQTLRNFDDAHKKQEEESKIEAERNRPPPAAGPPTEVQGGAA